METRIRKLPSGTVIGSDFFLGYTEEKIRKVFGEAIQKGLLRPVFKPMTTRGTPRVRGPWLDSLIPLMHIRDPRKICVNFRRV